MSQPLILREGEPAQLIELARPVAEALIAAEVAQVTPTTRPTWWEVSATTKIGVVRAGGLQIVIEPKIDINRIVFLMGYARRPAFWRDERVRLDPAADLPEALADAFARLTMHALGQGVLKGYTPQEDTLPVLRGRMRESDQLRRRFGRLMPLEVRYDEFTVDIAENQVLVAAIERLLRLPGVRPRHRATLQRLRLQLGDVSVARGVRPTWTPSRLNARYQPALEVAELILDGRSFEQRVGEVVVSGYLFNMASIFEDFVTVALREAFKPLGGRSRLQYATFLDEGELVPIRPDFVWLGGGRPRLVVDAKYKAEKPSGFPQADFYQMLAYCTSLGLPAGHLVYARGNEDAGRHVIRRLGTIVHTHTVDLTKSPSELVASMSSLADLMIRGDDVGPTGSSAAFSGEPAEGATTSKAALQVTDCSLV